MAVGDAAAAAGAPVVPQTDDARNGWNWINKLADWAALRWPLPLPVNKGGTGATTASVARDNLGVNRIQAPGGDRYLAIDTDGRVYGTDLFGRTYTGTSPSGSADGQNRVAVITPAGTLGVLTAALDNAYLPDHVKTQQVEATDVLIGALRSSQARSNTYTGNSPSGSSAGDNRVAMISPDGNLGALAGPLSADYTGTKDAYSTTLSAGNNPVSLYVDNNGKLGKNPSARKYKEDIEPLELDVDALLAISPVTYRLKGDSTLQAGFIADDFEDVAPQLVVHGEDGEVEGLHYERVTVALYSLARSLHAELAATRRDVYQLERRTKWLYEQLTGQALPDPTTEGTTAP